MAVSSVAYARSRSWKANRPGTCSVSRWARVSSASSGRACRTGTPARLAAAATEMSGPGCRPSSRNSRAAVGAERVVGPGEHRADVGGGVVAGEGVQAAAAVARARRPARPAGSAGWAAARAATMASASGSRAHSGDDRRRRRRLGRHPRRAEAAGQQLAAPRSAVSRSSVQRVGAVGGDQAGQLVAAGDHDQAARRAGQQRADLLGVAGVVQHDQHPPAGEQAAVQRRPARPRPAGIRCGRHAERVEEAAERLGRAHRPCRPGRSRAG